MGKTLKERRANLVWRKLFEMYEVGDKVTFERYGGETKGIIDQIVDGVVIIKRREGFRRGWMFYYVYPWERDKKLRLDG